MTTTLTTFDAKDSVEDIAATLKRDGGVIIRRLAPERLMDDVYAEIEANVAPADFESSTELWPEGNKTLSGLAGASPLFADRLLAHPKILDVADAVLLPVVRMGSSARRAAEGPEGKKRQKDFRKHRLDRGELWRQHSGDLQGDGVRQL